MFSARDVFCKREKPDSFYGMTCVCGFDPETGAFTTACACVPSSDPEDVPPDFPPGLYCKQCLETMQPRGLA
jgi:hypothetical protein